ncbi:sigma-54 interaction domain-containing protein [Neobacillus sp. NRS-1170]|uniref:sigma-54 interaction domain-containing protein n=1 Tax=Neobacillus sp. NRS-1170 TaxID=3233898 RepID=UPI003D2DEE12
MFVREEMTREIKALSLKSTLREAIQVFENEKIGLLPVVDGNNKLLGAFSRYSLYRALLNDCSINTLIETYLIHDVVTISENVSISEAGRYLKKRNTAHAVVISQDNRVLGILGQAEITRAIESEYRVVINSLNSLHKHMHSGALAVDPPGKISGSKFDIDDILSKNEEMNRLKYMARQAAPGYSNILLLGESGTGKELFAQGIHNASWRSGRFVKINCAAIPFELWESEFFGYAEGAFTGARRGGKKGKFEEANNGTLFLDEIGDMPLSIQVKLLRVLQDKEFERIGENKTVQVNVRIIAATNKNLEQMVASGEFRKDLFYRLHVIPLKIPPLRNRTEDIPLLASSISKKFSHFMGVKPITISQDAFSLLLTYQWPGNVRELENVIERAMNCMNGTVLESRHLPDYIKNINTGIKKDPGKELSTPKDIMEEQESEQNATVNYKKMVSDVEKEAFQAAIQLAKGNRTAAAKILGISRAQFYNKLKSLNIKL